MRAFLVVLLVMLCAAGRSLALDTLRPEQLRPGMKGYGLSVFKGTKPERFEVEVLGVLKNAFPKMDMILIRLSGADLEKHKVIAGMSGSPIYIEGKLIGALAYGWGFENEPLAGVTPIHNMLAELNHTGSGSTAPLAAAGTGSEATPKPLLTPLALGGFSMRSLARFEAEFGRYGFVATAGGSTSSRAAGKLEPGSAIGVELIRGDLNAVAIGTVTHIEKNKVLAFGHPFFEAGLIEAPAVLGEVHTVMSSVARSFKLASGAGELGALVGDWQSCIVADTQRRAAMIPVGVRVHNRGSGHRANYAFEVVRNELLSPLLVRMAVSEAVGAASGSSQDTMVKFGVTIECTNRVLQVSDTAFHPQGGLLDPQVIKTVAGLFATPFGKPAIKRIDVEVEAELTRRTAEIKRAYFSKTQVERGDKAELCVVLKPFGGTEEIRKIHVPVPAATENLRELAVAVLAGEQAPADIAAPESLDDLLNAVEKQHQATDLVLLVQRPGQTLQYRGKLLKQLPPSAVAVLGDDALPGVEIQQLVTPTEWVLSGQALARVPIRQE